MRPEDGGTDYPQSQRKSPRNVRNQLIREATIEANGTSETGIFSGFERELNAVHRLWIARRQLVLTQSPYPQRSSQRWPDRLRSVFRYYLVRLETFPILEINRLRFFRARVIAIVIVLLLAGFAISRVKLTHVIDMPQGQIGAEPKQGPSSLGGGGDR